MFTKSIIFPSIISAVNQVMTESDAKKKLLLEPEKLSPEVAGGKAEKKRDEKRAASGHSSEVAESHSDEKEDKALVKKMVKKTALKPEETKETELSSHQHVANEGAHTQNYMNIDHTVKNKKPEDTSYGRHRQNATDDSKEAHRPKTSWRRDPITAFTNKIHDTIADKFSKKKTNEEVESLEELDQKTLRSYVRKTRDDDSRSAGSAQANAKHAARLEKDKAEYASSGKEWPTLGGISRKLKAKEYPFQKEDVESLEELSKNTLGSYVKKASTEDGDTKSGREAGVTKAAHRTQGLSHKPGSVGGFKKYNSEDVELDERHLTPSETKTKEHNVKAMKKNVKGFKSLYGDRAKSVMYATATKQAETHKEEVEDLDESKSGHEIYHSQYSGAVHHALAHHAAKDGLTVHDDDYHQHVSIGPRKPAAGETVSHHIPAHNEKGEAHTIHMQVYNRGGDNKPYELNSYSSKIPKRHMKEEAKKGLKSFKAKQEDTEEALNIREKQGESQVRVDGETDMETKTIDTLKGRKRVGADYHNKALSYKVGLTVGESVEELEELSKEKLSNYVDKSKKDADVHFTKGAKKWSEAGVDHEKEDEEVDKEVDKGLSRFKGVSKAKDRLSGFAKVKGVNKYREYKAEAVEEAIEYTKTSPLGIAKDLAHKAFKKIRTETLMGKQDKKEGKE